MVRLALIKHATMTPNSLLCKLHVCNDKVCETKQLYLCELILIDSQDHQFEPVLAPPTTSEQHCLQSDEQIIHQKSHGRATYAIIT